jgi:hypothetical protein
MADAAYVYGVLADAPQLGDVPGVDPRHAVRAVRHGDLTALVSDVSLAEFGAEPLKRNLNDADWLERTARAHQRVLDRALAAATIVPMRLCTVCHDDAGVRTLLERDHDVLAAALERLSGREEWGVKLVADPRALRAAARQEPTGAPGSGRDYVDRVRRDRTSRDESRRLAREAARSVHLALGELAVATRILRKPPRELSGSAGEPVLNGAYLVDRERAAEFRARAAELGERQRDRGLHLEVTGPWPPYSFLADERERARAGVR